MTDSRPLNAPVSRACAGCGGDFEPTQKRQRYCGSPECRRKRDRDRYERHVARRIAQKLRALADELDGGRVLAVAAVVLLAVIPAAAQKPGFEFHYPSSSLEVWETPEIEEYFDAVAAQAHPANPQKQAADRAYFRYVHSQHRVALTLHDLTRLAQDFRVVLIAAGHDPESLAEPEDVLRVHGVRVRLRQPDETDSVVGYQP